MAEFRHSVSQAAFDAAFGGVGLDDAVALILGDKSLSPEQQAALYGAAGNFGYGLRFDPAQVGHIAFRPIGTKGCGNRGWHLLVPATPECRRLVNAERRRRWAQASGLPLPTAEALFHECHGHVPTLNAAVEMLSAAKGVKGLSNRAWRDMGFRPGHPVEGRALEALRKVGLV